MTWQSILLAALAATGFAALLYWQLIIAEGTYLGPRVVAKTYDWVSSRYDAIKQFDVRDEKWFVSRPLQDALDGVEAPLVLDVATGTGRLPLALLRNRFAGRIVGLDLSQGMLRLAHAKLRPYGDQVQLIWQDASELPFGDGSFDAVACMESLEFMPRPLDTLSEMARVLAPGGVLLLTNRVGHEALLLPGRAISRSDLKGALAARSLRDVEVRRWQVNYDLALARKEGHRVARGRDSQRPETYLLCPACGGRIRAGAASLACVECQRGFPVRQGVVFLADGGQLPA